MLSETKAASDTHLYQHESTSSLLPLELISSINSDHVLQYQSGNNISLKNPIRHHSVQCSMESINDNYQRFSNHKLINTHFPIANVQQDSKTSSSQLPTVPKQAGTFIHRLVNKFFSMTSTNQNQNKNEVFPMKRIRRERMNTSFKTRRISNDSHSFLNITSNPPLTPKRRKRRQRSKITTNNHNNSQHCVVCRRYRNCFSILPTQPLPTDSLEYAFESPMIRNTNATTIQPVLSAKPSISLPKIQLQKKRTLNEVQCQTIASAVELIFDTLISNYQQI